MEYYKSHTEKRYRQATEGFEPFRVRDGKGRMVTRYRYRGEFYCLGESEDSFRRARYFTAGASVLTLVGLAAACLARSDLNHTFYVGGFLFLGFAPELFFLFGAVKLLTIRGNLTVQQFRECRSAVYYGSKVLAGLLAAFLAGFAAWVCQGGSVSGTERVILVQVLLLLALQGMVVKLHRKENYRTKYQGGGT